MVKWYYEISMIKLWEIKVKDKCVTCGVESLYDREDHIDFRIGYIQGSGQLCLKCYDELYFKTFLEPKENKKTKSKGVE